MCRSLFVTILFASLPDENPKTFGPHTMNHMIQNHATLLCTSLRNEKRRKNPQAPIWQPSGLKQIEK